jgi:uncharacterized protein
VVIEDGSDDAAELWETDLPAASSILSYAEGRAALAAARRRRRLAAGAHAQAAADFEDLQRELMIVGIDRRLAHRAGELADEVGLRGYDAVHLASALALGGAQAVTVVSWERELSRAAAQCGCAVAP